MEHEMNGSHVTWRQLVTVTLGTWTAFSGLALWGVSLHVRRPHEGAATIMDIRRTEGRLDKLEERLDVLRDKVESLQRRGS